MFPHSHSSNNKNVSGYILRAASSYFWALPFPHPTGKFKPSVAVSNADMFFDLKWWFQWGLTIIWRQNAIKGCSKLCCCHLLFTFPLEWLGQAGLHNPSEWQRPKRKHWVCTKWSEVESNEWVKIQQETIEEKEQWSRAVTLLGFLHLDYSPLLTSSMYEHPVPSKHVLSVTAAIHY